MSEQRIQTVKIVWKSDDAKGKVTEFTRSVKGADDAVEQLNAMMGESATVTAKVAKNQKELTAERRKEATAAIKSYNQYQKLTTSLKNQISLQGQSAERIEKLTALQNLGANATLTQRKEVLRLVDALQKQRVEQGKVQGSMRGLRGQAQNLGWQLQDIAVQWQAGTDKMVIFSQQGSQIASGFGPAGAVMGALIAVGGALAGVAYKMITGKKTAKELAEAQKILNETFRDGESDVEGLTDKYEKLFKRNKELAILTARQAEFLAVDRMKAAKTQMEELAEKHFELIRVGKEGSASDIFAEAAIIKQAKALGITVEKYNELALLADKGKTGELAKQVAALSKTGGTKELNKVALGLLKVQDEAKIAGERVKTMQAIVAGKSKPNDPDSGSGGGKNKIIAAFEAEHNRTVKQTETIQQEYERRKKSVDDYVALIGKTDAKAAKTYKDLKQWETQALASEYEKRENVRKRIEKGQLKTLGGDSAETAEFNNYFNNLTLLLNQRKKLGEDQLTEKQRINALIEQEHERHAQAVTDIETAQFQELVGYASQSANMMNATLNTLINGAEQVQNQTAEMNDAQKAMFFTMRAISAAQALVNGMAMGGKWASTLALTPVDATAYQIAGTSMGAAQAAAIMGTTFAGMFDKGGHIPQGQVGIVSEYGDELVNGTLVKGPANVTSREDTAKIMGGAKVNVTVVNNAVGTVRAEVKQITENDVKIIVSEHFNDNIDRGVATSISKRGSKTDKAMRSNFNNKRRY